MWARERTRLARSSMPQSHGTANLPAPSGRGTSLYPVPRQSWQFSRGNIFVSVVCDSNDRIRVRWRDGKRLLWTICEWRRERLREEGIREDLDNFLGLADMGRSSAAPVQSLRFAAAQPSRRFARAAPLGGVARTIA